MVVKVLKYLNGTLTEQAACTTIANPGSDDVLPTEQAVRELVSGILLRHSGTSTGTGSDQVISHGFSAVPKKLELIPLDVGESTVFSSRTVDTTHFHITVSVGRNFAWVAEDW